MVNLSKTQLGNVPAECQPWQLLARARFREHREIKSNGRARFYKLSDRSQGCQAPTASALEPTSQSEMDQRPEHAASANSSYRCTRVEFRFSPLSRLDRK